MGRRFLLGSRKPHTARPPVTAVKRLSGNDAVWHLRADLSLMKNVRRGPERSPCSLGQAQRRSRIFRPYILQEDMEVWGEVAR